MHRYALVALVATLLIPAPELLSKGASAFDSEKWGADAATREWFKSLRNNDGLSCCDYADGTRLEDPDWFDAGADGYAVFAKGKWQIVPPNKVIKGTNRVGYAILWWPENWAAPSCFLPGARG